MKINNPRYGKDCIDQDYGNEFFSPLLRATNPGLREAVMRGEMQIMDKPRRRYLERFTYLRERDLSKLVREKVVKLDKIVEELNEIYRQKSMDFEKVKRFCEEAKRIIYK